MRNIPFLHLRKHNTTTITHWLMLFKQIAVHSDDRTQHIYDYGQIMIYY